MYGTLKMDLDIHVTFKNDRWTATAVPLGLTVFAKSEADLWPRLGQAMQFLINNYTKDAPEPAQKARELLDFHGIRHNLQRSTSRDQEYSVMKELQVALGVDSAN